MSGVRVGLDYKSVEMVANIYDFELTPFRMMVLQEIERWHIENQKS